MRKPAIHYASSPELIRRRESYAPSGQRLQVDVYEDHGGPILCGRRRGDSSGDIGRVTCLNCRRIFYYESYHS